MSPDLSIIKSSFLCFHLYLAVCVSCIWTETKSRVTSVGFDSEVKYDTDIYIYVELVFSCWHDFHMGEPKPFFLPVPPVSVTQQGLSEMV